MSQDEAAADLGEALRNLVQKGKVKPPAYPGVALKLQQLVASGNYGVVDVVKVVGADPALTATLLRYANSAAWRGAARRR